MFGASARARARLASLTAARRPFLPRSKNAFLSTAAGARFRRPSPITLIARPGQSCRRCHGRAGPDWQGLHLDFRPTAVSSRLRREPTKPVRSPSRSIPVRCTASTLAACPRSTLPATWLAAIPKQLPIFRHDQGFPRCTAQGAIARTRRQYRAVERRGPRDSLPVV